MPPKGFVGIKLTPQRKLMLNEVMQSESFNKPSEALDYALALAGDYVKTDPDSVEQTELPNYLNYYVGDTRPVLAEGTVAPLVEAERVNPMVSSLTWRLDALSFISNYEPTIVNVADAIDFALAAVLLHSRAGTITDERKAEVKKQVRQNAVKFREEVRDFLADNMADQEKQARLLGTKKGNADKPAKSSKQLGRNFDAQRASLAMELLIQHKAYKKSIDAGDTKGAAYFATKIDEYEKAIADVDLAEHRAAMREVIGKQHEAGVAVRTDAEGNREAMPF